MKVQELKSRYWYLAESSEHNKEFPLSTHTVVIRYLRPEFKFTAKIEMPFSQIKAIKTQVV